MAAVDEVVDERAQRDRLEQLQVEARALEQRLVELRPQLRPARKAADAAEQRHNALLPALWRLRTDNARLEVEAGPVTPRPDSAVPLLGLLLVIGLMVLLVVALSRL